MSPTESVMPRILIANDAPDMPDLLGGSLASEGFEVDFVRSGSQAIQVLVSGHFDVILLDWEMPQVPGVRICRGYRARGGAAYIIALSATNTAQTRKECLAAGANAVLSKPIKLEALLTKIKDVVIQSAERSSLTPSSPRSSSIPMAVPEAAQLPVNLIGQTLAGRYEILSKLGEGGMGIVYKARHTSLDRLVAVKVMLHAHTRDSAALQRFQREAKVLSAVEHPNLIFVHDFGETDSKEPFLVMELLEGKTLAEIIEKHGKVPVAVAVEVFVEICEGMQAAHDQGFIHRDLKPANVMLYKKNDKRMLKILDMGLAKFTDSRATKLTQTGQIFGSPLYMSPEQCLSKNLDHRTDIYSMGCLMYESLCGQVPFVGENFVSTSLMHVADAPTSIRDKCPEVPVELEEIVLACLRKAPLERPASMLEVKEQIVKIRQLTNRVSTSH